ncbi:hypothetical protein M885DRAFT_204971 [Pelagophyceae sp. CCMP2097]|nr:hypothetical protein M885DRAFT_204971 [Pelagophyceae sp. CCMP2097]
MTRTAALAALLNIYRVDDALVRRYAAAKSGALVDSLAALLQNAFDAAINGLEAASGAARGPGAAVVETQLALLQDLLYYAQDVLDMRVAGADALWCESLSAFLERVLSRVDGGDSACAWFVVSLFFRALQHAPLLRRCCRLVHGQRPTLLAALASVDEAVSVCAVLALDALDFGATLDEAAFERSKARSLVESLTLDPPAPESRGADARAGRRSLFDDEFTKQGRSNSSGPGRSNSSSTLFDDESSLFEDERSDAADTPDGQRGRDAPPTPGARVSGEAPPPGAVRSPTSDEAEAFRGDAAARLAESLSAEGRSAGATALVAHALGHMLDAPGPHVSKCAAGVRRAVSAAAKRVLALSAAGDARDAFDDEWRARRGSAASRRALAARLSQRAFVVLRRCDRPRGVPAEFADGPPTLRGEVQALLAVRGLLAQIGGGPSAFVHGDASDELLRPLAPRGDAETMQLAGRTCVACAAVARPEPLEPRRAGAAAGLPAPPSRRLDVYLVLDNEHLLLAVPDALRLASGRVLSRAPLHAVSAAVDANDAAALDVTVTSAAAVGLMRRELPPEAPQRARPRADAGASRWTLKLIFESEKTCRIARNLLDDRRRVERAKGYDDLRGHLEQLARLDDATQSPENAASTLRN